MAKTPKSVSTITHKKDTRANIPTAEYENLMRHEDKQSRKLKYPRNSDLDPQLVWRGKDEQNWSDLVVAAPPLYIQEKINPKHIIDDLVRQSKLRDEARVGEEATDLFESMFDGRLDSKTKTEFYSHDQNWTNRMILGDSLQVMASLAEREGMIGKVQCIYFDPPYGIKFGSNWQVSTLSRDVKDGKVDQISREPEMVKAFRDTWTDGIHSYLTYLRDRLTIAHDLLQESGSIFLQIGDENMHRIRALLDEIFGEDNFMSCINFRSMSPLGATNLTNVYDHILWYAKNKEKVKYRNIYQDRSIEDDGEFKFLRLPFGGYEEVKNMINLSKEDRKRVFRRSVLTSSGFTPTCFYDFEFEGQKVKTKNKSWRTHADGMERLIKSNRLIRLGKSTYYRHYHEDFGLTNLENTWTDTAGGYSETKVYVVQTHPKIIQRCILMTTDPGDLVLDPTCGSGTTATVAEAWGRRWITMDTSRVALALSRTRLMSASYNYFLLNDSKEGCELEEKLTGRPRESRSFENNIRKGFLLNRKMRIYLRDIANNKEIDVIWEYHREPIELLRKSLNSALKVNWEEWEIPSEACDEWTDAAKSAHTKWLEACISRQSEIDESISRNAEIEYLYDKPYVDSSRVRVTGPFTVESMSPHQVIAAYDSREPVEKADAHVGISAAPRRSDDEIDFGNVVLEHLRTAGVQQARKKGRIKFTSINPFPGKLISGDGRYVESDKEDAPQKRAGIFIGPEYGTLGRVDIVAAAREARDLEFDVLLCCSFNYDAHSSEIDKLADLPILKARMNTDLHMADELKNTGSGNLFSVFGEPDIEFVHVDDGQIQIKIKGVDVFDPATGKVISDEIDSIAAWFIDTDYNEESFFVRHAYFLGANDNHDQLKKALKAEVDEQAWETLYRDISRAFPSPETGRIAVKVINHLGDEVMKVFNVD